MAAASAAPVRQSDQKNPKLVALTKCSGTEVR